MALPGVRVDLADDDDLPTIEFFTKVYIRFRRYI
jgi:hypothetical protein